MTGTVGMWVWVAIIAICTSGYVLYKQGKTPWLKGIGKIIKLPKMFEPKAETQIERLKEQTEEAKEKVEELRSVLEAKRERDSVLAEKARLIKAIESVSPKSVEKEKREVELAEKKAQDAEKVKPRRL